ncbi:MAG: transcription elongation factor GreA [Candidatus Liptonbacteria bacterium RIFCSPLOWO2_01_FULL_53_13]|uniref:Transcription elongation factor GreA n=1 Tax=Candidatus Liptonbacteria bacterium RIFCSPLOWO2_01_FULL_53_13 TaxID=1798651 RepID=A0A1G2CL29_9BACT|nr:MAG: transcription elongation factor GreA [Candidatus Liptonbacteria bacterium RIFCSPLOWO2_01_FULL_53_13]
MDTYYVSAERLEELKRELEQLKTKKRMEVAEHLKRAKEYGDLSENSEYAEAREEQAAVEMRIVELEELLKNATVIKKVAGAKRVQVGSHIIVKRGGETIEYTIVGSSESDPMQGKISNESPLGKAFLDKEAGENIEVKTPGGKATYELVKIE